MAKPRPLPDHKRLVQVLSYNPKTGELVWNERDEAQFRSLRDCKIWNTRFSGTVAGYSDPRGYLLLRVDGVTYLAHRVIWKLMTGEDPNIIDHINGDKADNRWLNLREVDYAGNNRNLPLSRRNTSGVTGVCWVKRRQKWAVQISTATRSVYLGEFADFEEAVAARKAAELEHGYHENHGRAA